MSQWNHCFTCGQDYHPETNHECRASDISDTLASSFDERFDAIEKDLQLISSKIMKLEKIAWGMSEALRLIKDSR